MTTTPTASPVPVNDSGLLGRRRAHRRSLVARALLAVLALLGATTLAAPSASAWPGQISSQLSCGHGAVYAALPVTDVEYKAQGAPGPDAYYLAYLYAWDGYRWNHIATSSLYGSNAEHVQGYVGTTSTRGWTTTWRYASFGRGMHESMPAAETHVSWNVTPGHYYAVTSAVYNGAWGTNWSYTAGGSYYCSA